MEQPDQPEEAAWADSYGFRGYIHGPLHFCHGLPGRTFEKVIMFYVVKQVDSAAGFRDRSRPETPDPWHLEAMVVARSTCSSNKGELINIHLQTARFSPRVSCMTTFRYRRPARPFCQPYTGKRGRRRVAENVAPGSSAAFHHSTSAI